jgi:adenosylhomocysteine nucleosidase
MIVAVGGHGKAQFALQAQHLIEHTPRVERLFCIGAAGSLVDTLEFGDVVVGSKTVEHDYKLRFVNKPLPRYLPDANLLEEFQEIAHQGNAAFETHFGPIASGDEDVVDAERRREIRTLTDALCVAWEGSGGARAAQFHGLSFLEIRGITDRADANAGSSFHENLVRMIPNIADLLIRWYRSRYGPHDDLD